VADAQAVIFDGPRSGRGPEGIFGCARGAGRAFYLGPFVEGGSSGSVGTSLIVLAGPVVAYGTEQNGQEVTHEEIWVRNLRTGRVLHHVPNGERPNPHSVGLGETAAIVVRADGAVAWTVRAGETRGGIQLRSVDASGSHLLAMSPTIDPRSLALAGSTVYWTDDGKPASAQLK
jgi:hypothetical protein